uniref:Histone-lysine N-methyltransferase, H3 lysine-79 specific n=1 Tax=Rhabditophanes sp. KR3021 TaxID=114890 RepID=A0AC35TWB4_9BILA
MNVYEMNGRYLIDFPIISPYNGINLTKRLVLSIEDQEIYAEMGDINVTVLRADHFPARDRHRIPLQGCINKFEYDYPLIWMVQVALKDHKRLREIFKNESGLCLDDVGKLLQECAINKELYARKKDESLLGCYLSIVDFLNCFNRSVREYFVEQYGTMNPSRDKMPPIKNCTIPMARMIEDAVVSMFPTSYRVDINTAYNAFSNETYGELYFNESVAHLIKKTTFSDSTLIDMGSGIGNLVLQAAGSINARHVVGIEVNTIAYQYSLVAADYFYGILTYLNRGCASFSLLHANFLSPSFEPLFTTDPPVLIMNNLVFMNISQQIQDLILKKCKIGTKVISIGKIFFSKTRGNQNQDESEIDGWVVKQYLKEGHIAKDESNGAARNNRALVGTIPINTTSHVSWSDNVKGENLFLSEKIKDI